MKPSDFIGQTLSQRYEIKKKIGKGGFAEVFLAFDTHKKQNVAIKVLTKPNNQKTDGKLEERFSREAHMNLLHPNLVEVYDLGIHQPSHQTYIVMEYLRGHDLRQQLKKYGPMSPERTCVLIGQALQALNTAHEKKIIHRDLKPENLFLQYPNTDQEQIKILDFGIARIQTEHSLSLTGQILGTHKYLAPEYIQDNLISPQLDIYQMGLVLVELLTGRPVVNTDHAITGLRLHMRGSIELPHSLLLSPLGPIILQALSVSPTERFPTALIFAKALSSINPAHIPPASELEETIALDVYKKGRLLLDMSSEEEDELSSTNQSLSILLMAVIALIMIMAGIFIGIQ